MQLNCLATTRRCGNVSHSVGIAPDKKNDPYQFLEMNCLPECIPCLIFVQPVRHHVSMPSVVLLSDNHRFSLCDPCRFMTKKILFEAIIVLMFAVLAVIGYKLAPLLSPKTDVALPMSTCNLARQSCIATLPDGGQLEFSIEPRPIPALKPLKLQATLKGGEAHKVEVDFAGTDMNMGFNRPVLAGDHGRFDGQANLPVCITGKMTWNATVLVDTGKSVVAIPFRFEAAAGE